MTGGVLEQLYEAARGASRLLLLPHNDPDPDAIASTVALRYLLHRLKLWPYRLFKAPLPGGNPSSAAS